MSQQIKKTNNSRMVTLIVFARVKPGTREELVETGRVLFNELSKEPTFLDAWLHTTEDDPDLVVIYERWSETKESFMRDVLPNPFYKPYLEVFERIGLSREIHLLDERHAWHAATTSGRSFDESVSRNESFDSREINSEVTK